MTEKEKVNVKNKSNKKERAARAERVFETNEGELPPKSAGRGAVETVENWIADWRKQTEIKTRIAFGELAQLKLKNSIGI